jgi:hypothetical protein
MIIIIKIENGGIINTDLIDRVQKGLLKIPESIRYLRQDKFITKSE